ncbi:MAG: alpha/beta hydrolase, partial [Pseudomonadota bacterium]
SDVTEEVVPLMRWSDLTDRPLPQPTSTHPYGDDPAQMVDLWRPDGPGPHPVVLMIHGGCWQKAIADRTLMNYAAEDLRQRGMAVWNIEYRGVDEAGGAYPGIFQDVRAAAEELIDKGSELGLDTNRIVAFGHSAGGHLAAWLATQTNLPETSPLHPGRALPLKAAIISGGLADLEASAPITLETCLARIMDDLTGMPSDDRVSVFSDTSPAELLPSETVLISVNGDQDRIAPPVLGQEFTDKVKAAGGTSAYVEVPNTGHVELVSPGTAAFDRQAALLQQYLDMD